MKQMPVLPYQDHEVLLHGHLFIHHRLYMGNVWDFGELAAVHGDEHSLEYAHLIDHPHTHSEPEPEEEFTWE